MTPADWAGLAVSVVTIAGSFAMAVKWLVKHYLNELKPNGGSSLKDSINRLEAQIAQIHKALLERE